MTHPKGEDKGMDIDKKRVSTQDEQDDEVVDLSCGVGGFRTKIFGSKFSNLYVFTVILSISAVFHMMIWGVVDIHIKSLQRQFNIDASQTALFDTAARVGLLCTVLFPGHFAKRAHIPVMIGVAGLVQGVILMVPGIIQMVDPYELPIVSEGENSTDNANNRFLCKASEMNETAFYSTKTRDDLSYYALLAVQLLKGVIEPFHSHSLVNIYLDDNSVDKGRMAHFIGIQAVIMDLATPASKALNGMFTEIPVDLKPTLMKVKDQRFVGAWWLGFLCFGLASGVFSIPLILFPRRLITKKQQVDALKKAAESFSAIPKKGDKNTTELSDKKKKCALEDLKHEERRRSSLILPQPDMSSERRLSYSLFVDDKRPSLTGSTGGGVGDLTKRRLSYKAEIIYSSQGDEEKTDEERDMTNENQSTDETNDKKDEENPFGKGNAKQLLKDFPKAIGRLFRNPVFVIIIIDIFIVSIPISGTGIFRGLYVTNEFNVPMKEVAEAKALMIAVSNILGTFVSTWISSKVKTKYGYMWVIMGTYIFCSCVVPFYLVLGCDDYPVYGATGPIGMETNGTDLCSCDMENQLISCGSDGNLYYSPCVAGCLNVNDQLFSNCEHLVGNSTEMTLEPGLCKTPCYTNFVLYIVLHGVQGLVHTMAMVPRKLLMLRVVDPRDRGFAFSMFGFFWLVLAVPSPNLFGRVIDSACYIFDDKVCSLYNRESIRYIMGIIDVGVTGVMTINYAFMIISSKLKDRYVSKRREKKAEKKAQQLSKF